MSIKRWIKILAAVSLVSCMKGTPVWVPPVHISASCVPLEEAVNSYLAEWSSGNAHTAKARKRDLMLFLDFCKDVLKHTGDIVTTAQMLGHRDIKSTMRYTLTRESELHKQFKNFRRA